MTVIGTGNILRSVLDVADSLKAEGFHVRVINIHTIKPLDEEIIRKAVDETGRILTVEDHNITGGIGSAVSEVIAEYGKAVTFRRVGLHGFSKGYGSVEEVRENNGAGKKQIYQAIRDILK